VQSIGPQITDLCIQDGLVDDTQSARLFQMISQCSALQRLTLDMTSSVGVLTTDQFSAFLAATGQTLREINFGQCLQFGDEFLKLIATYCPNLEFSSVFRMGKL
jgi:hypothetical protein